MKINKSIIIVTAIILITLITSIILFIIPKDKIIDFEGLKNELKNEYSELYVYDQYDTNLYFGIDLATLPDSLFMSDYLLSEDTTFDPNTLIVVIKSKESDYYYELFDGFIYTSINNNLVSNDKIDLYNNAILKKNKDIVYLVLSKNANDIESIINKYI